MKITLLDDSEIKPFGFTGENLVTKKIKFGHVDILTDDEKKEFNKLNEKIQRNTVTNKIEDKIKLQLDFVHKQELTTASATLTGDVLELLRKELYKQRSDTLKVKVFLRLLSRDVDGHAPRTEFTRVTFDNMLPLNGNDSMCSYRDESKSIPSIDLNEPKLYSFQAQAVLDITECLPTFPDLHYDCNVTTRKILLEQKFCDFELVSSEGTTFPCHKVFLVSTSSVMSKAVEDDFKEGRNGCILMDDMGDKSIHAILEFIYCNSVHEARKCSEVAFELLKAADYYDMPTLWSAIATILLFKRQTWFKLDVVIKLLDFVTKKTEGKDSLELKKRMITILSSRSEELEDSVIVNELFPSPASKHIFMALVEANKRE